jgi:hypothetical protein
MTTCTASGREKLIQHSRRYLHSVVLSIRAETSCRMVRESLSNALWVETTWS